MATRPINYTSRDFASIKQDLENYAKRYYPTTFKDFSEASFGALVLDMVSYVGDQLSYYADFQTNESLLDSAILYDNVVRLAEIMGYKQPGSPQSTGMASFYIEVPAKAVARGPDLDYVPILLRGTRIASQSGAVYTLNENVDFTDPSNEITVSKVDTTTGNPTFFAIKASGQVISGEQKQQTISVGDYQRFLRIRLNDSNITQVLSVVDSQGNEYYQVDYLTQDIVLQQFRNTEADRTAVPFIMKTKPVPRRFITEFDGLGGTSIQFGYGSSDNLTKDVIVDPADVVLNVNGRTYTTDQTFDPTNLIESDKFGVVPTNTSLTVTYIANTSTTVNAAAGTLTTVISPTFSFKNQGDLSPTATNNVIASIQVENELPIQGDTSVLSTEEIRQRAFGTYAAQNRAVTRTDYINLIYRMPAQFGGVKRANVVRDPDSFKRNLNVYVLAEDNNGDLSLPNESLLQNTAIWLNKYRMINDTLDILSGRIINIGINFRILPALDVNKYKLLNDCYNKLVNEYINVKFNIGEAVYISEIYKLLNEVPGVVDTTDVEIVNKIGASYSGYSYDIDSNLSDDGRFLKIPEDSVAEVLLPSIDIAGVIT